MSFLQPWLLVGLPLAALPIIIHLINQRRFQTIHWAAMMFLLAAQRMARGYSRLRQWLIMLFRMLALATLVFAVSRPLASGWLGLAVGGRADTTMILLDRSPSMQHRGAGGDSKLDTGRRQLVQTLQTVGSARWVLIESTSHQPRELEAPSALLELPEAGPVSASADLPAMLQAAYDYIRDNHTGRTEIWICSDLRSNDWNAESGRWAALRDAFLSLPQAVRIHLLAYPQTAPNVSVRVADVRRRQTSEGAELLLSLHLARFGDDEQKAEVPVQIEIEGARSTVTMELAGHHAELKDHRIALESYRHRGWGRVSIPADANVADDDFYFVFDDPPPQHTIVVSEDRQAARPLQLAAEIGPDPALRCSAESLTPEQLTSVDWSGASLLIWHAPLPDESSARLVQAFVHRGGVAVFFPPANPGAEELFGVRWQAWKEGSDRVPVTSWRNDEDLLARTLSGAALPVGQLDVHRYCRLSGELTALATLAGGSPLLARAPTPRGAAYFWTTTASPRDSSFATGGIVIYAFVQRALAQGSLALSTAHQLDAGNPEGFNPDDWARLSEGEGLSTEAAYDRGAYGASGQLLAVNRTNAEDAAKPLEAVRVDELFQGLDYARVDDQAGSLASLVQEIWRAFLMAMFVALIAEALLCMPPRARAAEAGR